MVDRSLSLGTIFSANVNEFITKVDLIKKKVGELNATMASVSKRTKGFDQATKSVDGLDKSMQRTGRTGNRFSQQLGLIGNAIDKVFLAAKTVSAFFLAGLGISGLIQAFSAGTREIIDFDQALKNLQAITKATDAEVAGMGEVIKRVANETKFSTGEVAEGMVLLGQAGFNVQEAMQAMASVANLATGTLSDLKLTSDLLTTTIRAFGLEAVESARVSDVMANAINRSKLTIDKLRIAFNFVGAASAQAGLSLEETAASMMVLANNGLRASTIGTGLRQVMSRLLAPNRKLREEFKEQGIALERVNPATQGWTNALKNLLPILVNTETGVVNMAKAYQLFGLRGAQAAAILAKAVASGDYQKMIEYTYEVGAAARMAETQMEGLGVKLKNLVDRLKLVAVALGEAGVTDALKVLIDTLRATASAVADFIRSDVGQLVTAFAGWTAAIWTVIRTFNLLIKAVGLASKAISGRFAAALASVGGSAAVASSGFAALSANVLKIIGRFLKVSIVIGSVVTVIRYFASSIERSISSLEKLDAEGQTVIQTLSLYGAKIDELIKKREKEQDVTTEQSRLIERFRADIKELEKSYGELDIALEDNVDALQDNLDAINALRKAELGKSIERNTQLIKQYQAQIERTNFWQAYWNGFIDQTVGRLQRLWKELDTLGQKMIEWSKTGYQAVIDKTKEWGGVSLTIGKSLEQLRDWWDEFFGGIGQNIQSFVDKYKGQTKEVESLTDGQRQAFVRLALQMDKLSEGTRSIESIVEEMEKLTGIKIDTKGIDQINDALKKVSVTIEETREKWEEQFDDLPSVFKEMYDKMDAIRKADFAKVLKQIASEEAAFEKLADSMGMAQEERYAAIAHIRAKHLREFAESQEKEVKINEDAIDDMLTQLDYFVEKTEDAYNRRTTNIYNNFFKEYDASKKNKEQLLKLEDQFIEQMIQAAEDREARLSTIGKDRNKILVDLERQTVNEITKLNAKMYKDLQSQLKSRLKDARKDLEDLQNDLTDLERTHYKDLREINQLRLTDEQKWLDDRRQAHVLFNKAVEENDEKLFKEARELAKGLAREVQNEQGDVVRNIESTSRVATNMLAAMFETQGDLMRGRISEQKKDIKSLEDSIVDLNEKMVEVQRNIDQINSLELALEMDKSLTEMKDMYDITSKFKSDWEALQSKVITLTVKYNHIGTPPLTQAPSQAQQIEQQLQESPTTERKLGGLIKKKLGGMIYKAFASGGKLPGFGGGDKVKALLEPGEYVVRKEAVAKYGENLFSALNTMSVGAQDVGEVVAQKMGGLIKKLTPKAPLVQHFASGGPVMSASGHAPVPINIYLQPKFLTGDRRSMRLAGVEIKKALEDLNVRWGKR